MTDAELLALAFAMRDAQRRYYDNGRRRADLTEALTLEYKFDRARRERDDRQRSLFPAGG